MCAISAVAVGGQVRAIVGARGRRCGDGKVRRDDDAARGGCVGQRLGSEAGAEAEAGATEAIGGDQLENLPNQLVGMTARQIPLRPGELVPDPGDQPRRADHPDRLGAADMHAEQMVEADQVVEMAVADEDAGNAQQGAG